MNNGGFTLLWSKMLTSSLWQEPASTRIVFFTLLMLKDKDGFVPGGSIPALAHTARVTVEECQTAITTFLEPDPGSTTSTDDGRRIRKVEGGWSVINHEQYRYSTEAKREFWKQQKAEQRQREAEAKRKRADATAKRNAAKNGGKPLSAEVETVTAVENGTMTQEEADARAAETREKASP